MQFYSVLGKKESEMEREADRMTAAVHVFVVVDVIVVLFVEMMYFVFGCYQRVFLLCVDFDFDDELRKKSR